MSSFFPDDTATHCLCTPSRRWAHTDNISPSHLPPAEHGGGHHKHWPVTRPKYLRLLREHRYSIPSLPRYRSVLKGIVMPRSDHEVPDPTLFHVLLNLPSAQKEICPLYTSYSRPSSLSSFPSIFSSHLRDMNSLSTSYFDHSSFPSTPSLVSSTVIRSQFPFKYLANATPIFQC